MRRWGFVIQKGLVNLSERVGNAIHSLVNDGHPLLEDRVAIMRSRESGINDSNNCREVKVGVGSRL
jgi:hypothetical protein